MIEKKAVNETIKDIKSFKILSDSVENFSNILYAPNITNLGFFNLGQTMTL